LSTHYVPNLREDNYYVILKTVHLSFSVVPALSDYILFTLWELPAHIGVPNPALPMLQSWPWP